MFEKRGFLMGRPDTRVQLERIGKIFLAGYHAALEEPQASLLADFLQEADEIDLTSQGFAFEGAGMALALRDIIIPRSKSLASLMKGGGHRHIYMLHVGAGWALARIPGLRIEKAIQSFDPLLRWLVVDGYGFHEGYFHWPRAKEPPRGLSRYGLDAFDQGLGRALWFIYCGDVEALASAVRSFAEDRRRNLWGGLGLAAAYAGGVPRSELVQLNDLSPHASALARGAAFAAAARELAGNPATVTEMACQVFCRMTAKNAAHASSEVLSELRSSNAGPGYQKWISGLEQRFTNHGPREALSDIEICNC